MPRGKHGNHVRGSDHPRWTDGRMLSQQGYVKVRVGQDHPLADPNGYAYEHVLVWVSAHGSFFPWKTVLHHRNGDKTDNRLENLELLTREQHNRRHARPRDDSGRFAGRLLDGRTWDEMPEPLQRERGGE